MGAHGDRRGAGLDKLRNAALGLCKYIALRLSFNVAIRFYDREGQERQELYCIFKDAVASSPFP
jgi:hypothetical protein